MSENGRSLPIGVLGLGTCTPDRVLTNKDFEQLVDTSDEWIVSRTGIRERRILAPDQKPSDIASVAARRAIEDAGLTVGDIDSIIYCTYTPDYVMPSAACIIQQMLGIPSCMAVDLNGACTGFVYGLQNAFAQVKSGLAKRVLVIACDCASRLIDYSDRSICVLFGDGAGAVVVGEVPEGRGIVGNYSGCDGNGAFLICQKVGGAAFRPTPENLTGTDHFMQMNGREVFKFAVRVVNEALEGALRNAEMKIEEVDLLVPHQANVRIINAAMERFGFNPESVVINMDKFGNTSSASIPLALQTAREDGRLKQGTTVATVAFGAGLTYGATILRW